jgi:hypothetical protein
MAKSFLQIQNSEKRKKTQKNPQFQKITPKSPKNATQNKQK